jgi:hypothetical protein
MSDSDAFRHSPRAPTTPPRAPTNPGTDTAGPEAPSKPFKHLSELDHTETPPGFRLASSGNIIPDSMDTSSHSARKVYVRDGEVLDVPEYPQSFDVVRVKSGGDLHEAQREKSDFENADDKSTVCSDDVPGTEPEQEQETQEQQDEQLPSYRTGLYRCLGCGMIWDGNAQCQGDEEMCGAIEPYVPLEDSDGDDGNDDDDDDDDDEDLPRAKRAKKDINPAIADLVDKAMAQADNLPLAPLPAEREVLVPETPPSTPKPAPSQEVIVPETPM